MQLEEINDDCLETLFQFLRLQDVVGLNVVSSRFRQITKRWITKHEINFSMLGKSFRDMEPREFFAVFGNFIKRINIDRMDESFEQLNLLPEYCKSIEYMQIFCNRQNIGQLSFIGRLQPTRCYLNITGNNLDMTIIEQIIKLHDVVGLQLLNASIIDYRLNELRELTELNLVLCDKITTEHFIQVFQANRNLTRIKILACQNIEREAYRCMAQESRHLEMLEFDAQIFNGEFIPGLKHVKQLIIHNVYIPQFGELILRQFSNDLGESLMSLTCEKWSEFSFPEGLLFPNLIEFNVLQGLLQDKVDIVLRRICNSCPRLAKLKFLFRNDVTQDAALDLFRRLKSLVSAEMRIGACFSVSLYKEIVEIRKKFGSIGTLKLVVRGKGLIAEYEEVDSFMKGDDYAFLRKFVEIKLTT